MGAKPTLDLDAAARYLSSIPEGRWTTYGDVAVAAGRATTAAQGVAAWIGRAGHTVDNVHRVLNRAGEVNAGWKPAGPGLPRSAAEVTARLQREGVRFADGRADPAQRWRPVDAAAVLMPPAVVDAADPLSPPAVVVPPAVVDVVAPSAVAGAPATDVVATLRATDPAGLAAIGVWLQDAELLPGGLTHDPAARTVELALAQQPRDPTLPLPGVRPERRTLFSTVELVPLVRCRLRFHGASGPAVPPPGLDGGLRRLHGITLTGGVAVATTEGLIGIPVAALAVELDVTAEIVRLDRRRRGRIVGHLTTTPA